MRRTPVVLGVLSMVFGGLVAAWSLFGLLTQSMVKDFSGTFGSAMAKLGPPRPGAPDPKAMMDEMGKMMEALTPYMYTLTGGMLLMSLLLGVVGFGLYKRQSWSRPGALMWAVAALAFIPFQLYVQIAIVMPRSQAMMAAAFQGDKMAAGLMDSFAGMQTGITVVTHILFYAPFPVILLFLMGRRSARNDLMA
jgi:hypothetical protein